jgi:hypothetical protein
MVPTRQGNSWIFPNGKILPVVSGGEGPLEGVQTDLGLGNTDPPVGDSVPGLSEFAQGILGQIPEMDRPIMAKHLPTWDSNVTKKFQSIHEEYKPYKDLGSVEDIQQALQFIGLLNDDPIQFIDMVKNALKESGMGIEDDLGNQGGTLPEYEGLPSGFVDKFTALESNFNNYMGKIDQFMNSINEKEQLSQVDKMLGDMHNTHGDFDNDYVLLKMSQGLSQDDAIKSWKDTISKYGSPSKPAPVIPTGASGSFLGQADPSKMSKADKLAKFQSIFENAQ